MDDLLAEFLAETREMLEAVGGELVAWESDPADRARLDAIFRFVHTVKGNCGFFDFPRLEKLSHSAEDALSEVRAGRRGADARLVTAVLAIVDRIGEMIDSIENGTDLPADDDERLVRALDALDDDEETCNLPAETVSGSSAKAVGAQRSIRLPVGLLDNVMSAVSDLVLARNELSRRLRESGADPSLTGPFERLSSILGEVRENVTRMRMQRIEHLFGAIPRLVRDLSAELGKQVMVDLEGGDVELDREVIDMIRDPITHIIRNAIDHGIEGPQLRLAAGKREIGTLRVSARQTGNRILLVISDDGRGFDREKLIDKAVSAGAITRAEAGAMSDHEIDALVFEPGLTTAEQVTSISGRGVGMDVVRENIERIGGSIVIASTPGDGARVVLHLPLTISIIPALTIVVGGQLFTLPRSYVEEIIQGRSSHTEFATIGDSLVATVRGKRIPCLQLARTLGLDDAVAPDRSTLLLVRLAGGDLVALAADRVIDHADLVVKPLAPAIMAIGFYAGSTLLDDGSPVLMLDIVGIASAAGLLHDVRRRTSAEEEAGSTHEERWGIAAILVEGLDGRLRAMRMAAVDRIRTLPFAAIDLDGERPQAVIDDRILALAGTACRPPAGDSLEVLQLSDGSTQIAYAVAKVIDTVMLDDAIVPAAEPGEIEGTTLIGGELVEVLDTFWLFSNESRPVRDAERPLCRLPLGDEWARTILAPLVEASGYRIVGAGFEGAADIAIALEDDGAPVPAGGHVIRLHSDPDAAPAEDAIYRYDRAGLIAALETACRRKSA